MGERYVYYVSNASGQVVYVVDDNEKHAIAFARANGHRRVDKWRANRSYPRRVLVSTVWRS